MEIGIEFQFEKARISTRVSIIKIIEKSSEKRQSHLTKLIL